MRKLLMTTAIVSSMAFAGAAAADETYIWLDSDGVVVTGDFDTFQTAVDNNDVDELVEIVGGPEPSLLQQILADVEETQVSLLNAAENLANIDATVNIDGDDASGLLEAFQTTFTFDSGEVTGMFSEASFFPDGNLGGASFFDPADILAALQTDVEDITTTAIGALNTGIVGNTLSSVDGENSVDEISATVMNLQNAVEQSVASTSNTLATSTTFEPVDPIQVANLALNSAELIDSSVNVDQIMANIDGITTTAIGALNTGDIATDINTNTTSLSESIVGN